MGLNDLKEYIFFLLRLLFGGGNNVRYQMLFVLEMKVEKLKFLEAWRTIKGVLQTKKGVLQMNKSSADDKQR